jgi:hypothetical protein
MLPVHWKDGLMIKIQIAAKAAWDGLLLLFFGQTLMLLSIHVLQEEQNTLYQIRFLPVIITFLVLLLFFLRNSSLPLCLTGTTMVVPEQDWKVYFIKLYRLMCVFVGMILLCRGLEAIRTAGALVVGIIPSVRDWITLCIDGNISLAIEKVLLAITCIFYPFGYLLFCGYLLLGADRFIRWQIRMFTKQINRRY